MSSPAMSAIERLRTHTFEVHDKNRKRPNAEPGVLIKVGVRGERFWCKVKGVRRDGALLAVVDNDLLKSQWKAGDEIVVLPEHVLETSNPSSDMTFTRLLSALGSAEATMPMSMLCDDVTVKPKTFFVLPDIN